MGRHRHFPALGVFMNTRFVGRLVRRSTGAVSFTYDPAWLAWEHRMPVSLSLPLRDDPFVGAPVMAVFDNLLPDNADIRRRVAERLGAPGIDAYSLLGVIGRDCVGALQFLPDDEEPRPADHLVGEVLSETEIGTMLSELATVPLGIRSDRDFRISIAGAQEKTALLRMDGHWVLPSGTTPTTHIVKPAVGRLSNGMDLPFSVENEYFCLKLLGHAGLRVAQAEMASFDGHKALVVERFDRLWTRDGRLLRLPQEDCCQALSVPPTRKYQSEGGPGIVAIMDLLRGSDDPVRDRKDFFTATILFWMLGATDGHAKNFSLALQPGGRYHLAPLYDVLTVQPNVVSGEIPRRHFKLAMRFGTSNHYRVGDITGRHIVQTGRASGLSLAAIDEILEEVRDRAVKALEDTVATLPGDFPGALVDGVRDGLAQRVPMIGRAG